jgi:SAM-dependent methyltransferase
MSSTSERLNCIICSGKNRIFRHNWLDRCDACGFLSSTLEPCVNSVDIQLDEQKREYALGDLRRRNFEAILNRLAESGLDRSARILDVGCGHGWFLSAATARGYDVTGIEPDVAVAAIAQQANGNKVRAGFFPEKVEPGETFDIIVFNDVFEHLPEPDAALIEVRRCLAPDGVVLINLPISTGLFYRVSDVLDRMGYNGPFARMWQKDFPSPHRSYFSPAQLAALSAKFGFVQRARYSLPSLRVAGLWQRLRYDPNQSVLSAAAMWGILVIMSPLVRFFPADIGVQIFSKGSRLES